MVDAGSAVEPPRETPLPEKALNEEGRVGATGRDASRPAASVAVPLWLPPPKKLVKPPPELPVEACVVVAVVAAAVLVGLKAGWSLHLTKGHLFSQALIDCGEVSKHLRYPKA